MRMGDKQKEGPKKCPEHKKGQYFSFDAITGLLIFVISVGILVTYWYNIQNVMQAQDVSGKVVALRISDQLFTEGYPADWNLYSDPSDISLIGLFTNRSMDPAKINQLDSWLDPASADRNKTLEKMKVSGYSFQVVLDGDTYDQVIGPGPTCNINETSITSFTRIAPVAVIDPPVAAEVTVRVWTCP